MLPMIPTFRLREPEIGGLLKERGGLGAILVDLTSLARIERRFGRSAYQSMRQQIDPLFADLVGPDEVLGSDEREGDRVIIFSAGSASGPSFSLGELRRRADHVAAFLTERVARFTLPYQRERPAVEVGYGFVIENPLLSEERQILRLIEEAQLSAGLRQQLRDRDERERLVEIIYRRDVWTGFQAIVDITSREVLAHEGLSRGPRGSDLERPAQLFGMAGRYGVLEELERACRRQAFIDWEVYGAPGRLFVNTIPATVRDASFLGRGVLDYLGSKISPDLVTLEITEREVIENLTLYRDAMQSFIELGFSFAIDDLGAGHTGLDAVAQLGVSYLKIDLKLVRDLHLKPANRQVVKAILEMAEATGATPIAEGIEQQAEVDVLADLGIRWGQGYYFSKVLDPYAPRTRPPDAAFTPVAKIDLGPRDA